MVIFSSPIVLECYNWNYMYIY